MSSFRPVADLDTHEVTNQPPPLEDVNLFTGDRALLDAVRRAGGAQHEARLTALGVRCGSADVIDWGVQANRVPPVLDTHDRYGRRIDEVTFHPAYHQLMALGLEAGLASAAWDGTASGHVLHAAVLFLTGQADSGTSCPMTMTYASVPALAVEPGVGALWIEKIRGGCYDPAVRPAPD